MHAPLCEVVGCPRMAAWTRITNIDSRHEDFLCQCCWQALHSHKPVEAACYVRSNVEDNFNREYAKELEYNFGDETVILIR